MKHQRSRAKHIKNNNVCIINVCIGIINVSSMLHQCRIAVSLMNKPVYLTTIMNHQCYQCVLDWGIRGKPPEEKSPNSTIFTLPSFLVSRSAGLLLNQGVQQFYFPLSPLVVDKIHFYSKAFIFPLMPKKLADSKARLTVNKQTTQGQQQRPTVATIQLTIHSPGLNSLMLSFQPQL